VRVRARERARQRKPVKQFILSLASLLATHTARTTPPSSFRTEAWQTSAHLRARTPSPTLILALSLALSLPPSLPPPPPPSLPLPPSPSLPLPPSTPSLPPSLRRLTPSLSLSLSLAFSLSRFLVCSCSRARSLSRSLSLSLALALSLALSLALALSRSLSRHQSASPMHARAYIYIVQRPCQICIYGWIPTLERQREWSLASSVGVGGSAMHAVNGAVALRV
jgi:hypothetical protein